MSAPLRQNRWHFRLFSIWIPPATRDPQCKNSHSSFFAFCTYAMHASHWHSRLSAFSPLLTSLARSLTTHTNKSFSCAPHSCGHRRPRPLPTLPPFPLTVCFGFSPVSSYLFFPPPHLLAFVHLETASHVFFCSLHRHARAQEANRHGALRQDGFRINYCPSCILPTAVAFAQSCVRHFRSLFPPPLVCCVRHIRSLYLSLPSCPATTLSLTFCSGQVALRSPQDVKAGCNLFFPTICCHAGIFHCTSRA